jgi:RNA polymerase sigma factor (sigma-70 family)
MDPAGWNRLSALFDDGLEALAAPAEDAELVALDEALERLGTASPRARRVIELRFFTGLSLEETAEALDLSARTVQRDWLTARAWLRATLAPPRSD